jgi:hypothetical protein
LERDRRYANAYANSDSNSNPDTHANSTFD